MLGEKVMERVAGESGRKGEIEQEYLSPKQVAKILGVSEQSVRDWFIGRRGVLDLGTPETMHKRRRRCLRISRGALNEFIAEHRVK